MKTIIHIPTGDFAFIEQEYDEKLSPEEAVQAFNRIKDTYKPSGDGLTAKEVDSILDCWFSGKGINSELYDKRNPEQDKWFQAVKRSLARVKRMNTKTDGVFYDLDDGNGPGKGENGDYSNMD